MFTLSSPSTGELAFLPSARRGATISGLTTPHWSEAFLMVKEVPVSPLLTEQRKQELTGPMSRFLSGSVGDTPGVATQSSHAKASVSRRTVTYPLGSVIGATLTLRSHTEIAPAMRELLSQTLPDFDWWVPDDWQGPFEKYLIVHKSLPAPPHEHTGEPMSLEIYGQAVFAAGLDLTTPEGQDWFHTRMLCRVLANHEAALASVLQDRLAAGKPVAGDADEIVVAIQAANYSNVMYPGVEVPCYL